MTGSETLRARLRAGGVTDEQIDEAIADGTIVHLVAEQVVLGDNPGIYSVEDVVEESGIDRHSTEALWRALGFPVTGGDVRFGEVDLMALESAKQFFTLPEELPVLLHQTRVMSAALARIAETFTDRLMEAIANAEQAGVDQVEIAESLYEYLRMDELVATVDHLFRRQLLAVIDRRLDRTWTATGDEIPSAVGFADLAGFTRLSRHLSAGELASLVDAFESETIDTVAQHGGRVVKTIGDEIMFVAEDPYTALDIGLRLTETIRDDSILPDIRIGLSYGRLVLRRGDYFGDAVNKAARLTNMARPGTVLVSHSLHEEVADGPFSWRSLGRIDLKDIGPTKVWVARRP